MELETINKLYLELSQVATATTRKEREMQGVLRACLAQFGKVNAGLHTMDEVDRICNGIRTVLGMPWLRA